MPNLERRPLSASAASRVLNVSIKTVTRWCQDGTLRVLGKGAARNSKWQIDPASVRALAAQRRAKILASLPADTATDAPVETIDVGPVTVEPEPAVVAESVPAQPVEPAPAPAAEAEGVAAVTRAGAALAGVPVEALLQHEDACDSCWSLDDAAAHLAGDKEVA